MRILILTRSYPAADDLYQYPFVHRRVLAYRSLGHDVAVFRLSAGSPTSHQFEGITCRHGDAAALKSLAEHWQPHAVAAHGLSEAMWPAVEQIDRIPVYAWLHGSEIPAFFRQKAAALQDPRERASAIKQVDARIAFWRTVLWDQQAKLKLIFPSRAAKQLAAYDLGDELGARVCSIIPNPIDTDLFRYVEKVPQDRFSILSIRPYDSSTYGNDLAVSAVLNLTTHPDFLRMRFTFIGDGPLFWETLAPIANLPNVVIRKGFLSQAEIVEEHARHGVFLVPTRLDTHGVSRDEAMASGLVPVTNGLPVVREFADEECAGLAGREDPVGLAFQISNMVEDSSLFLRRSRAAADRVRQDRSHHAIIPAELALLASEEALV